jgi:molybdopterin-guanine dinucleotide biosynthesis protein A
MVAKSGGTMVSGVALAGGRSKRLGRNKAIEKIGDQSLIERVVGKLSQVTSETVVVVAEESKAADLNLPPWVRTAADLYPGTGSLGGIFTGLSAVKANYGVVVACDMPFLNVDLIRFMLDIASDYDAVVPRLQGRPEPLHAVYSKSCVGPIERCLQADQLKIAIFFEQINVAYLEEDDIEAFDPSHLSFFNVNTQEDLDKALALEAEYGLNDE